MFERPTVFIVGAGGSVDFGFPTGEGLKEEIARRVNIAFDYGRERKSGDAAIIDAIIHMLRDTRVDPNTYFDAGRWLASAMPQAISIDNFLHTHSGKPELVLMGKLGIAATVLSAEAKSKLVNRDNVLLGPSFGPLPATWHSVFCKMLLEGVRTDYSSIFDNVSIITFNYDRCIEHYVVHFLANYLGIDADQAAKLSENLEVFHPYGRVGKMPWQKGQGVSHLFGTKAHPGQLVALAGQIKTFTERVEDDDMMERLHGRIAAAEIIVYLGFSYGDMNMDLLTIDKSDVYKHVFGTAFGMSDPNIRAVDRTIRNSMGSKAIVNTIDLAKLTCHDMMQDYWRPILKP